MIEIRKGWRVVAPPEHPEAGRVREFRAKKAGLMPAYVSAIAWHADREPRGPRILPGHRLLTVEGRLLIVPTGISRHAQGWRARRPTPGVKLGAVRIFGDAEHGGDPRQSLDRAIDWINAR